MLGLVRNIVTIAIGFAIVGCGGGGNTAVRTVERDSSGVTIVENHADTAALRAGWSLSPQPSLTIGGGGTSDSAQIYQVAGAVRLMDGRIVVADAGVSQVRVFAADGRRLAAWGHKGEGPGEYTQPHLAGRTHGDSVVVFDASLRRATVLDPDNGGVRSYLVGNFGGGYPNAQGVLANGSIAIGGGMYFSSETGGIPEGMFRAPSKYLLVNDTGALRTDLGDRPAAEMFSARSGGQFSMMPIPFARITGFAPAGDHVWLGTGDSWELSAYTLDGKLERIARFDRELAPVTAAMRAAETERQVADAKDDNDARATRARLAAITWPAHVPPYELFRADALGCVWIGETAITDGQRTWTIIDARGHAIGRVTTPARTLPLDIGRDYILAVTRDDLDVERLTVWRLTRPG